MDQFHYVFPTNLIFVLKFAPNLIQIFPKLYHFLLNFKKCKKGAIKVRALRCRNI